MHAALVSRERVDLSEAVSEQENCNQWPLGPFLFITMMDK